MLPIPANHAFTGVTQSLLAEQAALTLEFFSYGLILTKRQHEVVTSYAVDPTVLTAALADKFTFSTGLLTGQTLAVRHTHHQQWVVEYRPPQLTGIWLDGISEPVRVPLPGLVLLRVTTQYLNPEYHLFAVKQRPRSTSTPLYRAPLPNIYESGAICWGSVRKVSPETLKGTNLAEDWQILFGSAFGNHSTGGKSRSEPGDIRRKLIALDAAHSKRYPTTDLLPQQKRTIASLLGVP